VKEVSSKTKNVYGYFNNHFSGYAVENALWLLEKLDLANEIQQKTLTTVHEHLQTACTECWELVTIWKEPNEKILGLGL
jgi:hypothetical protein